MKKENLPEAVRKTMEFEETRVEHQRVVCPVCEKKTVDRNLYIEQNWYVDMCIEKECPYYTCGFIDAELN